MRFSIPVLVATFLACSSSAPSRPLAPLEPRPSQGDPSSPAAWIADLDDPSTSEVAVAQLALLKDSEGIEKAFGPLIKVWERDERPASVMKVIIELAAEARGAPHWNAVLPTLYTAITEVVATDADSLQSALIAVDALGRARDPSSVPVLVRVAEMFVPDLSPQHRIRLAAIAALGKFGDKDEAVDALIGLLRYQPKHRLQVVAAAAALALADTRSPRAVGPLLRTLFKIPPTHRQCRSALIAIGPAVVPELVKMLQGRHDELNRLGREMRLNAGCDKAMGPETNCRAPALLPYNAARLLGDFYSAAPLQPLLDELDKPGMPAYFEGDRPGATQHRAVLEALGQIGDARAAPAVWRYANKGHNDVEDRALAIEVFSRLGGDTQNLPMLGKGLADDTLEAPLRRASALAYARLVEAEGDLGPLRTALAAAPAGDGSDEAAREARSKRRRLQGYLARAKVGVACAGNPACYAGILAKNPDEIAAMMGEEVSDWKSFSDDEKQALAAAAMERAFLDLGKLGAGARPILDQLLERLASTDRRTRRDALRALVRIAPLPCPQCVSSLDELGDEKSEAETGLSLATETRAVRDYFSWAGK